MLNFVLSPRSLILAGLALIVFTAAYTERQSAQDTTLASRYHQRQHSASSVATGRVGGGSSSRSHNYRQHIDYVRPAAPSILNPKEKIATKPATGVRS